MNVPFITRLAAIIVTSLVLHLAIALAFLWHKNSAHDSLRMEIASLRAQWSEEDLKRELSEEEQLSQKYGTTKLDRVAFDPRLDVNLALLKLGEAVMPREYLIQVSADRFTEFKLFVNVYNMPETSTLAGYLKEIFSHVDPRFVYQIIFTDEERYWIIDQSQLLAIPDWKNADLQQIKRVCFS